MQTKDKIIHNQYARFLSEQGIANIPEHIMPNVIGVKEAKDLCDAWAQPVVDALKEAKELIEWMSQNMSLDCPDENHHSFVEHLGNAYSNTMHLIDEALKQYNQ